MAKSKPNRTVSAHAHAMVTLRAEIESGKRPPGMRLPSLRALAKRFHTSVFPMQTAISTLERDGFVERRHGSGVYVLDRDYPLKMTDSALLLMRATGHVDADMMQKLFRGLHTMGMFAAVMDTVHGNATELTRRALHSKARFILMEGSQHFNFGELASHELDRYELISVLSWETDRLLDRVHRILVDHPAGSRLLTDYLWEAGHRRLALVGPNNMQNHAAMWDGQGRRCPPPLNVRGAGFETFWRRRGGQVVSLTATHEHPEITATLDEHVRALLDGADAPSAVVGLRDVDAWDVREAIRRVRPEALPGLTFVGNGNTPWSQMSYPPFSTFDWNLDKVAALACGIIRDIEAGRVFKKPVVRLVPPRLLER